MLFCLYIFRLDRAYATVMACIKNCVRDNALGLSVTYDIWTSVALQSYIDLSLHFISEAGELMVECARVKRLEGSHTGEMLAQVIDSVLAVYEKPLIAQCIDILMFVFIQ
jgi:hypothetical protein